MHSRSLNILVGPCSHALPVDSFSAWAPSQLKQLHYNIENRKGQSEDWKRGKKLMIDIPGIASKPSLIHIVEENISAGPQRTL